VDAPETRYARTADGINLAYQSYGSGPDVVLIPPLVSNVEVAWEHEVYRRVFEYTGRHVRIVQFDKRGIGGSDGFDGELTLDQRIGDIAAVMDAEGLERAHLVGLSEGGLMAQLFAARHPERVERLVLVNTILGRGIDYEAVVEHGEVPSSAAVRERFGRLVETWGREPSYMVEWMMPSQAGNESFVRWIARFQRLTASPAEFTRQIENVMRLRGVEDPSDIAAPCLLLHVVDDAVSPVALSRYLAERIPGARYVELEGADHFLWVMPSWREISDIWIGFLTDGVAGAAGERRFAAILFTDLVASTESSATLGDARWREVLDSHARICDKAVTSRSGRVVKSTGDGLLAVFDRPSDAVAAASEIRRELAGIGLTIRAGVHAGEVEVHDDGDVSGLAVNLASRVESTADAGQVLVSSTVRDVLLGGDHRFDDAGDHTLKGFDGTWRLYSIT
jgi:class 3 adenylate cyclase